MSMQVGRPAPGSSGSGRNPNPCHPRRSLPRPPTRAGWSRSPPAPVHGRSADGTHEGPGDPEWTTGPGSEQPHVGALTAPVHPGSPWTGDIEERPPERPRKDTARSGMPSPVTLPTEMSTRRRMADTGCRASRTRRRSGAREASGAPAARVGPRDHQGTVEGDSVRAVTRQLPRRQAQFVGCEFQQAHAVCHDTRAIPQHLDHGHQDRRRLAAPGRSYGSLDGDAAASPDADRGVRVTRCSQWFDGDDERPSYRSSRVAREHHHRGRRRIRDMEAGRQAREPGWFGQRVGSRHGDQEALERNPWGLRVRCRNGHLLGLGPACANSRQNKDQGHRSERGQHPFHGANSSFAARGAGLGHPVVRRSGRSSACRQPGATQRNGPERGRGLICGGFRRV